MRYMAALISQLVDVTSKMTIVATMKNIENTFRHFITLRLPSFYDCTMKSPWLIVETYALHLTVEDIIFTVMRIQTYFPHHVIIMCAVKISVYSRCFHTLLTFGSQVLLENFQIFPMSVFLFSRTGI